MKKILIITESQSKRLFDSLLDSPELINEYNTTLTYNGLVYNSVAKFLGDKQSRKVGNNTWIEWVDDYIIGYKLHGTYILKISPTNTITLNTGGWETATTKQRLNYLLRHSGIGISTKNGVWYISDKNKTYEYFDGIKINLSDERVIPPDEWENNRGQIVRGYRN